MRFDLLEILLGYNRYAPFHKTTPVDQVATTPIHQPQLLQIEVRQIGHYLNPQVVGEIHDVRLGTG